MCYNKYGDKMKFKMNEREWIIKEIPKREIIDLYINVTGDEEIEVVYGLTNYEQKKVYLNEDVCKEKKRKTLLHELMHVYIEEYVMHKIEYDEEELCDFSANSHDIIHKIVEEYFKK